MCPSSGAPWPCVFICSITCNNLVCMPHRIHETWPQVHVQTHQICVVPFENCHGLMCMSSHYLYTPGTHHTWHLNQDDHHSLCSKRYIDMHGGGHNNAIYATLPISTTVRVACSTAYHDTSNSALTAVFSCAY